MCISLLTTCPTKVNLVTLAIKDGVGHDPYFIITGGLEKSHNNKK